MRKKLSIVAVIFALVLIAAFFYIRTTPQYSLYQLAQAYKTRDLALAKEYVDIDGLSDQVADEAINVLRQEIDKPSNSQNEWENLGQALGKSLVESVVPSLKQTVKDEFKKSFTESIEGKSDSNKNLPDFKPLGLRDFRPPGGRIHLKSAGAIRLLTIQNQKGDNLVFRMRHDDGKWKIVGWENFGDIAKELAKEDVQKQGNGSNSQNAQFGVRTSIGYGWFLTVSVPEQYLPKDGTEPGSGNKFMTIEVTYDNSGNKEGTYDASNFDLKDKEDHRYKRSYSGREPHLDSSILPAGQKVKGYITYEVPVSEEITAVIYSSESAGPIIFNGSQ